MAKQQTRKLYPLPAEVSVWLTPWPPHLHTPTAHAPAECECGARLDENNRWYYPKEL